MNIFSTRPPSLKYDSWTEFKKFIDGTYCSVAFFWEDKSTLYTVITEEFGSIAREVTIFKDGGADQLDFENNFQNLAPRTTGSFEYSSIDGYTIVRGAGTAGSPVGGILTIQGDPSGEPIPVSGNITTSNASVSDNDLAIPLFSNLTGGSDGTNLRPLRVFDVDTGGGQQWVLGVGLRKASGGGSVEAGTSSDPIRIDPTGTTTQPISGTVTANQGGTWTIQPGNTANTTPWLTTISQGGNTVTVTGSNALKIDGSAVTQPVSGTVTANAGTGNFTVVQTTASNLRAQLASESATGTGIPSTAVMVGGSDGANLRSIFVDSSGRQFVVGGAANGAAVAGNPVLIAGSDGANTRTIRTATDGTIRIDPTGTTTQPISGTITANIGTSGSLALDATITAQSIVDNAGFTDGITRIIPSGFIFDEVAGTALTENDAAAARIDSKRAQIFVIEDGVTRGTRVAVKGASTAAIATDPALVVTMSPNSPTTGISGTVTANQGTANTLSNRWPVIITDGTDTAAVKAASTAALAADPSLVIGLSPNSPLPTGSNTIGVINQGTSASLANAWSTRITDATNGPVAVKAASTAPVATDQALVVVLSPNQPAIPTTNAPSTSVPNVSTGDIVLSSATTAAIRRTTYTEQTTNFTGSIASTNAADTAAGTGARTIRIYYMNAAGTTVGTEDATLNGTTGVNLVTSTKCFIEKIEVLTAGSSGSNTGIISLYTGANKTGTVVGTIAATDNTTFWAHHYVLDGVTCNVTGVYHGNNSTVSGGVSVSVLKEKSLSGGGAVERQVSDFIGVAGAANPFTRIYGSVIQVTGPCRLVLYVTSSSAASITYRGSFDSYDV